MKKQQKKTKEITVPVYMMNRELSWLKFNERVLNEAGKSKSSACRETDICRYLSVKSG